MVANARPNCKVPGLSRIICMTSVHPSPPPVLARGILPYGAVRAGSWVLHQGYRLISRLEVRHPERLPATSFIGCINHTSYTDTFVLCSLAWLVKQPLAVFAADSYRRYPPMRWGVVPLNVIWVHRGAVEPSTIKSALQLLREGCALGVAPEGTRSPTGTLQAGKTGAVSLALTARVPLVPIALENARTAWGSFWRGQRQRLVIRFGHAWLPPEPPRRDRSAAIEAYTEELMCRIAALLPASYHGHYAGHPRVRELQASGEAG